MHSHGRSRRKRSHNIGGDDGLLVSRTDEPRVDSYSRPHHFPHHTDSYRPSSSTRDSYDSNREASRTHDEWRSVDTSRSSHDRYDYSSTKEVYQRSRDHYNVSESRDSEVNVWSSSSWNPPSRYDYAPASLWRDSATYDSRNSAYDTWNSEDSRTRPLDDPSRTVHAVSSDRSVEGDSVWHRDSNRKDDKRTWLSDSGWDSHRVETRKAWDEPEGWGGLTPPHNSYRPEDDRTWQPAPTWQPPHREDAHTQRSQNGNKNPSKKPKGGKKGNQHSQQKRDWRTDDSNLNNWPKRDSHGASGKAVQRTPKKRKQIRSLSHSRSPSPSSYYSRRSSRGRSRSRSTSPKRRRRDSSPVGPHSHTPSERGRMSRTLRSDKKHSKSPRPHGRVTRRRSVSSVSTTSRSRSSSPVNRPRAVHRLPTATSIKDIKVAISTSNSSKKLHTMPPPREAVTYRNGNVSANGKHAKSTTTSAFRSDQYAAPVTQTSSMDTMPPPSTIPSLPSLEASSNKLVTESRSNISTKEPRLGAIKSAGFKPIGQTSSAVKRFFPGDDDDDDQLTTPSQPRTQFAPAKDTSISSLGGTSDLNTRNRHIISSSEHSRQERSNDIARTENHESSRIPLSPPSRRSSVHDSIEEIRNDTQYAEPSHTDVLKKLPAGLNESDAAMPSKRSRSELYSIISQVGEGTFGKVYKARNTVTKVHVALKRIRMATEKDGFPVTAMREIKLLQSLRHENVVRLYEMMVSNADVYMVFEYMDHDLTGILSQSQFEFTPAHLKSLCHQMLNGLGYLHHKGVIHRDIKGSNILINNRGELKLADFGLARFYQKRRRSDYTNRVITLWYRAPELLFGATVYGPEVDMWSAGCIMLELFTKKPVFQGNDEIHQLEVVYKIFGTPTPESWADVMNLPWYELVKPKDVIPNRFRELFNKWLSPAALDLAEQLLSYDPLRRITAAQALDAPYFKQDPAPSLPVGLSTLEGEWHELETKRERAKKRRKTETAMQ